MLMHKYKKISTVLAMAVFIFSNCRDFRSTDSVVQWGELQDGNAPLLALRQHEKVGVCGDSDIGKAAIDETVNSVKAWLNVIGRDKVAVDVVACDAYTAQQMGIPGYKVSVVMNTKAACNGAIAFTQPAPNITSITYCKDASYLFPGGKIKPLRTKSITMHEVGHNFGLCDQYSIANENDPSSVKPIDFHSNCSTYNRAASPDLSIMNAARVGVRELMPDDIVGVRLLACLNKIPANKEWFNINKSLNLPEQWKKDARFYYEMKRLMNSNIAQGEMLPECLIKASDPVPEAIRAEKVTKAITSEEEVEICGDFSLEKSSNSKLSCKISASGFLGKFDAVKEPDSYRWAQAQNVILEEGQKQHVCMRVLGPNAKSFQLLAHPLSAVCGNSDTAVCDEVSQRCNDVFVIQNL